MNQSNEYIYTVWLRDNNLDKEEQDYEFPVCIIIRAENESGAKEWGDKISRKYVVNNSNLEWLKSEIELSKNNKDCDLSGLPIIDYGYEPTDKEIGL